MSILKFLFGDKIDHENTTKPFHKNKSDAERRLWFIKTRPWHKVSINIIDSLVEVFKNNPMFEVFVIRSMELAIVDDYVKIDATGIQDKKYLLKIISSILATKAQALTAQLYKELVNGISNKEKLSNLYGITIDLAECSVLIEENNFLAFLVLSQLKNALNKTDEAKTYARKGLEALARERSSLRGSPLQKSSLNLFDDYQKSLDAAEILLTEICNTTNSTRSLNENSEPYDEALIDNINQTKKDLQKLLEIILKNKFKVLPHQSQVSSFVLNFPLYVLSNKDIPELKPYFTQYIDYICETDPLNYIKDGCYADEAEYRESLEEECEEWRDKFKVNLYDLDNSETSFVMRVLADGDVRYVSPKSIRIINKVLANARNEILKACKCQSYVDGYPTDVSEVELYLKEGEDPEEIQKREKVAKLKQKSKPIDYRALSLQLEEDYKKNELIERVKVSLLDSKELNSLMKRVAKAREVIGEIPERFLKQQSSIPDEAKDFKISEFLGAFDSLSLVANMVMDYVYLYDFHGGEPFPYTRKDGEDRLTTADEYCAKYSFEKIGMLLGNEPSFQKSYPYTRGMRFEKKPMGYFQFALFNMLARRFYLFWHSNYNDRTYFFDASKLKSHIKQNRDKYTDVEASVMDSVDITPKIQIHGDWGKVSITTYEMNQGYSLLNVYLKYPNIFYKLEDKLILKSKSTILY